MSIELVSMNEVAMENTPVIDEETQRRFQEFAIRRLVRKLDWRLIPFLSFLELASYIIRTSIGM